MAVDCRFQPAGLILAGGRGQRLGGRDKGLMPWQGRPVAEHLSARWAFTLRFELYFRGLIQRTYNP